MQENARKEASLIISGAQLDADKIIADVRQQCAVLQQEINTMVQKRAQFEASLRSLLENYLSMLGGERNNVK
jgi:cell division initiation protein